MMEKLYVLSSNNAYHLKVENDATPMRNIIDQSRKEFPSDEKTSLSPNNRGSPEKPIETILR